MRSDGFTLIELLVTIAVMTIVATIAVPGFQGMLANNRLAADYNVVLSGLNQARSEAIKRRENVTFRVTQSSPWEYRITTADNSDIAIRSARGGQVSVTSTSITFNALGRRANCTSGCDISVDHSDAGDLDLRVSTTGRIGKPTS
ncbi:prepilin-type N-terminal cleavage/methylation domain-containing protein [Halomonas sp. MCCC 1A17488]|uniref:Type II secretion system protein H n=1 Tax=Billgrantia sulfidoxydans TaxID=2733484 RepID=A0ABX7WBM7_9GAMM|nr:MULTISPECIES: GspH/FimT family pseudopilin [Halomonas]MCE8017899.1 prepilin-type N-terminal cleavage/methylation domain-containing protein [Halomonas sp. MCCC 1A17488]MCG3241232.1 prepilin-type N-terminal cleavage/methylation domain-containing protein [Halomonas sp. MCCC 1A17488]QPP49079.1 GspH/FimT family pseudopilin [Halomonas sp. SS10-MC5]QTP56414.1 prepilin-type N-terminal cleavage/methylation domain-containing protein [Halomonas sulfidoxydans]